MVGFVSFRQQFAQNISDLGRDQNILHYHSGAGQAVDDVSIGAIDQMATQFACSLLGKVKSGDRVMLLYPSGVEFIVAFLGCLYAGVVAVPVSVPSRRRGFTTFQAIVADADAALVVGAGPTLETLRVNFDLDCCISVEVIAHDKCCDGLNAIRDLPEVLPDQLAFLQYTSGSTGTPKGVMVSHGNLHDQMQHLQQHYRLSKDSVMVSWLPFYHDMGLIGMILLAMHVGAKLVLMQPAAFMRRPMEWLELMSHYRGTFSFAPNFAYELCAKAAQSADLNQIDLSSVEMLINAAEPVHAGTMHDFNQAFMPCGLSANALCAGFGLAEATLVVSCATNTHPSVLLRRDRLDDGLALDRAERDTILPFADYDPSQEKQWRFYPSNGDVLSGHTAYAVNPETHEICVDGQRGEIWFGGANVPQGYWRRPDVTAETFQAYTADGQGPFLRTGDFGTVIAGQLFILGRMKDIIIRRGRNLYPQDLERSCALACGEFKADGAAAFGIQRATQEGVVLVQELNRAAVRNGDFEALAATVRQVISADFDIVPEHIIFIKPHLLPRTTSGKIRRRFLSEQFLAGKIDAVYQWSLPAAQSLTYAQSATSDAPYDVLCGWLLRELALPQAALHPKAAFADLGFESLHAADCAEFLQTALGIEVKDTDFWEYPSLGEFAEQLDREGDGANQSVRDQLSAELDALEAETS